MLTLLAAHPHPLFRLFFFLMFVGGLAALISFVIIARARRRMELVQRLRIIEEKIDRLAGAQPPK